MQDEKDFVPSISFGNEITTVLESLERVQKREQSAATLLSSKSGSKKGGIPKLNNPGEAAKILDLEIQFKALQRLAKRRYDAQPACFSRGKDRFDSRIVYDEKKDVILWNNQELNGSRRLKSNVQKGEHMGAIIMVLMVKNESKIIQRALESLRFDVDGFIILDTGSTDDTVEKMWYVNLKNSSLFC
jgi:hypothetical protein